jgi:hypothetical protein
MPDLHNVQQLSDAYNDLLKRVESLERGTRAIAQQSSGTHDALAEAIRKAKENAGK